MGAAVVTLDNGAYSPVDVNAGWEVRASVHLSTSYATGGDTFTAAQFGLDRVVKMICNPGQGYDFQPDLTNSKILAYSTSATQVTATTDLSAISFDVIAWGP